VRHAAKCDTAKADIVAALRKNGIEVYDMKQPVDLLCRWYCFKIQTYRWQPLEVKTAYGKKAPKARIDKRQTGQTEFIAATRCPVVTTPAEALAVFGR
jgi:hypothetical protein